MFSQAVWFFLHTIFSLLAWAAIMAVISLFRPESVPAVATLIFSCAIPMLAGYIIVRIRPSEVATLTWLAGMVLFMIIALWVLDMPTGPGACFRCGAPQKLWFTFFSMHRDSGMLDGQGRLLATWPSAAMIGYAIGAKLAMRGVEQPLYERSR